MSWCCLFAVCCLAFCILLPCLQMPNGHPGYRSLIAHAATQNGTVQGWSKVATGCNWKSQLPVSACFCCHSPPVLTQHRHGTLEHLFRNTPVLRKSSYRPVNTPSSGVPPSAGAPPRNRCSDRGGLRAMRYRHMGGGVLLRVGIGCFKTVEHAMPKHRTTFRRSILAALRKLSSTDSAHFFQTPLPALPCPLPLHTHNSPPPPHTHTGATSSHGPRTHTRPQLKANSPAPCLASYCPCPPSLPPCKDIAHFFSDTPPCPPPSIAPSPPPPHTHTGATSPHGARTATRPQLKANSPAPCQASYCPCPSLPLCKDNVHSS
jgi:hypothetical protein